jgi:hypothetical protein
MRVIFGLATALVSMTASAAPTLQITSFARAGTQTTAAELCGRVNGGTGNEVVQVNSDPDTKDPGHYFSLVGTDGTFCIVISTATGTATASIKGSSGATTATLSK